MKRFLLLVGVFAALTSTAVVATASNGAATPYKATWTDVTGASATCSGAHVVFTNGANNGTFKESETCLLSGDTSRVVAGTWTGAPYFYNYSNLGYGPWYWLSDYPGNLGQLADSVTVTNVDNGNGTFTQYAVSYYH
jgi:hypothetical protein